MKTKLLALSVFATLAIAPAGAQTLTPPGLADPVTIKVTRQQLLLIGQGLQELPAKLANPLLNELQAQLNAADKEAADKTKAPGGDKATKP